MSVLMKNRYVAFFDILGFSNWIETDGSLEVFRYVSGYLNLMIRASMPNAVVKPDMNVDLKKSEISYINFSDSIVYYSADDSYESFKSLILVAAEFMNLVICGPSRMIRGAISHGEFYTDTEANAYVGKALIDAYRLEEEQNWLGLSLHKDIVGTKNFEKAQKEFSNFIVPSLVPLKKSSEKPYCLNWANPAIIEASFNPSKSLDDCLKRAIKSAKNNEKEIKKIKTRISNTKEFIKHYQNAK